MQLSLEEKLSVYVPLAIASEAIREATNGPAEERESNLKSAHALIAGLLDQFWDDEVGEALDRPGVRVHAIRMAGGVPQEVFTLPGPTKVEE